MSRLYEKESAAHLSTERALADAQHEIDKATGYLTRNILAPSGAQPLDDLVSICTQVDHIVASLRTALFNMVEDGDETDRAAAIALLRPGHTTEPSDG